LLPLTAGETHTEQTPHSPMAAGRGEVGWDGWCIGSDPGDGGCGRHGVRVGAGIRQMK
jgi:hypothetical protein